MANSPTCRNRVLRTIGCPGVSAYSKYRTTGAGNPSRSSREYGIAAAAHGTRSRATRRAVSKFQRTTAPVAAAAIPATTLPAIVAPIVNVRFIAISFNRRGLARKAALLRACGRRYSLDLLRVMLRRVLRGFVKDALFQRLNLPLMLLAHVARRGRRSVWCHVTFFHVVHIFRSS